MVLDYHGNKIDRGLRRADRTCNPNARRGDVEKNASFDTILKVDKESIWDIRRVLM